VAPPGKVTAPDLTGYTLEDGFDFTRLGVRVPTIMVSSFIAPNTVVNSPMHHGSFMKTVGKKWNKIVPGAFPPLTPRVADAPEFTEVFTATVARPACEWPVIPKPVIPESFWEADFTGAPLSKLGMSIIEGVELSPQARLAKKNQLVAMETTEIDTVGKAMDYLRSIPGLGLEEPVTAMK
jgi:phospholipase C